MGYGSYSHAAHVAMTSKRASTGGREVFTQSACHPLMDPKGLGKRESRDSEDHPESVGIIFALDVSGSMGDIPRRLATHTLPAFMQNLLEAGVPDPQVLFMAIGFADGYDRAPLQVGQFESTERLMDQWLTWMYLEGGGAGGNESYELAMYVASRHTSMDCVEKRSRRGYLFITGDEPPNPVVSKDQVARWIGPELSQNIPIREIITEVQRSFEPFYLIPDPGRGANVGRAWRDLLGDRVVTMETPDDTSFVAAGLVSLMEGAVDSLDALAQRMLKSGLSEQRTRGVVRALTPFASSLGKDGAPLTGSPAGLPTGEGPSGYER